MTPFPAVPLSRDLIATIICEPHHTTPILDGSMPCEACLQKADAVLAAFSLTDSGEPVAWIRGLQNATGAQWRELTFNEESAQVGLTVQGGDRYHDCVVVNSIPLYTRPSSGALERAAQEKP